MQAFLILDHQNRILSLKPPLFWTVPKKFQPLGESWKDPGTRCTFILMVG